MHNEIMSESESRVSPKITIAKWTDRFFAWLIDFVIISIVSTSIIFAVFGTIELENYNFWAESTQFFPTSILFFSYWAILEYKTGQTIGKKILGIKTTDMYGNNPSLKGILISSFGKSFLIPIDVFFGWILTNQKRQRIFNKLGDTIIIKMKKSVENPDVDYIKD